MSYSGQSPGSFGMTRGQLAVLAILAVISLVVVVGGGFYVLSDSGLIGGAEREPVAQSPTTPSLTSAGESLPTPSATQESGGKLAPAWTATPFGLDEIDYVQWAIQLSDLPPGFKEEPQEERSPDSGLIGEDGKGAMVNSFFFTREGEDAQFIIGFTGLVLEHEQDEFDADIFQSDFIVEKLVNPFDHNGILEEEEMMDLDNLGDIAVGYSYLLDMEGVELRLNLITFRRDIAGVVIIMGYADGFPAAVPIRDLATMLDQRIIPTLPGNP